jgi:hypothetical protein
VTVDDLVSSDIERRFFTESSSSTTYANVSISFSKLRDVSGEGIRVSDSIITGNITEINNLSNSIVLGKLFADNKFSTRNIINSVIHQLVGVRVTIKNSIISGVFIPEFNGGNLPDESFDDSNVVDPNCLLN